MKCCASIARSILWGSMFFCFVSLASAYPGGIAGRTLKTSRAGCGGCHGSSATPAVIATITGPSVVLPNQTVAETLIITGGPAAGGGCDIAATAGTLARVSTTLRLLNGELVQSSTTTSSGGRIMYIFNYTAPAAPRTDTLFAIGLSANRDGGTDGDAWNWAPKKVLSVQTATDVGTGTDNLIPREFGLEQNYPNPFNPATTIKYQLPVESRVVLKVYNMLGQEVATLLDQIQTPGYKELAWNAGVLPSGMYFYQLSAGPFAETRKMLLIR